MSLRKQFILFPSAVHRGNIEIFREQNEVFPEGPVTKCLLLTIHFKVVTHKEECTVHVGQVSFNRQMGI